MYLSVHVCTVVYSIHCTWYFRLFATIFGNWYGYKYLIAFMHSWFFFCYVYGVRCTFDVHVSIDRIGCHSFGRWFILFEILRELIWLLFQFTLHVQQLLNYILRVDLAFDQYNLPFDFSFWVFWPFSKFLVRQNKTLRQSIVRPNVQWIILFYS